MAHFELNHKTKGGVPLVSKFAMPSGRAEAQRQILRHLKPRWPKVKRVILPATEKQIAAALKCLPDGCRVILGNALVAENQAIRMHALFTAEDNALAERLEAELARPTASAEVENLLHDFLLTLKDVSLTEVL